MNELLPGYVYKIKSTRRSQRIIRIFLSLLTDLIFVKLQLCSLNYLFLTILNNKKITCLRESFNKKLTQLVYQNNVLFLV